MKRILLLTITLFFLMGQMASLEHQYHEHDTGEHCDVCLSSSNLDNGLSQLPLPHAFPPVLPGRLNLHTTSAVSVTLTYYPARAPPVFS